MNKQWSNDEIEYLTTHVKTMTLSQLSTGLKERTIGGVRYKLREMGMSAKVDTTRRGGIKLRVKKSSPLWRGD